MISVLCAAAGVWWLGSVVVLLASCAAACPGRRHDPESSETTPLPPVSAIVPFKDLHAGFDGAQQSLFRQDYPGLEILLAMREDASPAADAVERIRREFPAIPSRIVRSSWSGAASPKLNTLWPALGEARNDLILTKDSNLRLAPGELADLVREMTPGTGLVSTIAIAREPRTFPAWIETAILNNYHGRVLLLGGALGLGFGLGKIMLFRRSELMRAGGFERLAWALGEDMALADALQGIGLRTVLARRLSSQALGARTLGEVWQRQLRWMIVWRVQMPAAFAGSLLGSAAPTAAAGAAAATLVGIAPWLVAATSFAGWWLLESLVCAVRGWPLGFQSLPAFVARETLTPFLWLRACTTRQVQWGGTIERAGSRLESGRKHQPSRNAERPAR